MESLSAAVFVFDEHNQLVDWNPPAATTYLNDQTRAIGTRMTEVFAAWQPLLARITPTTHMSEEVRINGQFLDVQVSPILSRSQRNIGCVVTLSDVTERVAVREELLKRTKELEKANVELILARNTAEDADRAKSQFVATMSHELRTPLSAMMLFIELVAKERHGSLNPKQKDSLAKAIQSGRHLLSLINEVLDITKIEAGMMSLTFEADVDLRAEVEAIDLMIPTLMQEKPITWSLTVDPTLPKLYCDRRRLFQVLLNLVSNACKFTLHGTVSLELKRDDDHLLIIVRDTGEGIPEKDLQLIFQPFKQSESAIKHTLGTGLGLPICKFIAEAHQGRIWAESCLGEGSSFYVRLPLNFTQAPEVTSRSA
jgi:signal transduction histidine kinase